MVTRSDAVAVGDDHRELVEPLPEPLLALEEVVELGGQLLVLGDEDRGWRLVGGEGLVQVVDVLLRQRNVVLDGLQLQKKASLGKNNKAQKSRLKRTSPTSCWYSLTTMTVSWPCPTFST